MQPARVNSQYKTFKVNLLLPIMSLIGKQASQQGGKFSYALWKLKVPSLETTSTTFVLFP